MRGGFARNVFSGTVVLSVLLSACEVEFTPDLVPLKLGTAPVESFPEDVAPGEEQGVLPFTSADAMDLCGSDLAWGDGEMGACLAPGGEFYYMWANPDEVYWVPVNTSEPDQLGFFQAVIDRGSALDRMGSHARGAFWKAGGLGITMMGLPLACAALPLVGCVLDFAGILVTGGLVIDAAGNIFEAHKAFLSHSRRSEYYLCKVRGLSDQQCRSLAGIRSGDLGGTDEQ